MYVWANNSLKGSDPLEHTFCRLPTDVLLPCDTVNSQIKTISIIKTKTMPEGSISFQNYFRYVYVTLNCHLEC